MNSSTCKLIEEFVWKMKGCILSWNLNPLLFHFKFFNQFLIYLLKELVFKLKLVNGCLLCFGKRFHFWSFPFVYGIENLVYLLWFWFGESLKLVEICPNLVVWECKWFSKFILLLFVWIRKFSEYTGIGGLCFFWKNENEKFNFTFIIWTQNFSESMLSVF